MSAVTGMIKVFVEYNQRNIFAHRDHEGITNMDVLTAAPFIIRLVAALYIASAFAIAVMYFMQLKRKALEQNEERGFSCFNRLIVTMIFGCVLFRSLQLTTINTITVIRCLKDVSGQYSLEAVWIFTRGIIAPTRDATELALICFMICFQDKKNLQAKLDLAYGGDRSDTLDTKGIQ